MIVLLCVAQEATLLKGGSKRSRLSKPWIQEKFLVSLGGSVHVSEETSPIGQLLFQKLPLRSSLHKLHDPLSSDKGFPVPNEPDNLKTNLISELPDPGHRGGFCT